MPLPGLCVNPNSPINWRCLWNRGLVSWWMNLPQGVWGGGRKWRDLNRASLNDGTLTNMAFPSTSTSSWGPTTRPGGFGEVRFDGSDDYVTAGSSWAIQTSFTASVWFKCPSGQAQFSRVIEKGANSEWNLNWGQSGDATKLCLSILSGTGVIASLTSLADNSWHCACVVGAYSGSGTNYNFSYYVDAQLQGTSSTVMSGAGGGINFGRYGDGGYNMAGALDNIRLRTVAASASEVLNAYLDDRDYCRRSLNWVRPRAYAGATSNRRRRYLTLGAA